MDPPLLPSHLNDVMVECFKVTTLENVRKTSMAPRERIVYRRNSETAITKTQIGRSICEMSPFRGDALRSWKMTESWIS